MKLSISYFSFSFMIPLPYIGYNVKFRELREYPISANKIAHRKLIISFCFQHAAEYTLKMVQKENLVICFVARLRFLQGEFYAKNKVHSKIMLFSVHPQSIDRLTKSSLPLIHVTNNCTRNRLACQFLILTGTDQELVGERGNVVIFMCNFGIIC